MKNKCELIVSLTSYPARIDTVHKTIKTLLNQTLKADRVILWLAEEQFTNRKLPENLIDLKEKGLTIEWCEDMKSYKKLIPALKKYPDAIIVTADDDAYYKSNWLELLYREYINCKDLPVKYIICHRITKFYREDNDWKIIAAGKSAYNYATYLHKLTGIGGVLYPPKALYYEITNIEKAMNLAPTNDDIWFWFMAILNGTRIKYVNAGQAEPKNIEGTQKTALWKINDSGEKLFWKAFYNLLREYPVVEKILFNELEMMKI